MPSFRLFLLIVLSSGVLALGVTPPSEMTVVKGIVTWVDTNRGLVVLQDGAKSLAFNMDLREMGLAVGERVVLEGKVSPLIPAFPDFPDKPSGKTICQSFEAPTNWANFYLTRMRGFLHPPATGKYTFWIASDDSSELWLSADGDASNAQKIASVGNGRWTEPRQWTRFPSQQSQDIFLEAGKSYYIEALQQEGTGRDCLAVAWRGPGFEQAVIDGNFLSPLAMRGDRTPGKGILREYWANFPASDFAVLKEPNRFMFHLREARVVERRKDEMPKSLRIHAAQKIGQEENFRWVEVEGRLTFSAKAGRQWNLELVESDSRIMVHVTGDSMRNIEYSKNSLLRVHGVCEGVGDSDDDLRAAIVWVGDPTNVAWLDTEENWKQHQTTSMHLLSSSNPQLAYGHIVRVHGRVFGEESPGLWSIQGDDSFHGYISKDRTNWNSIGAPVEFTMSNSALVGFAVASHQADQAATVRFENAAGSVTELRGAEIGDPPHQGEFSLHDPVLTVRGYGQDIWSAADQCFFAYRNLEGEGEIMARVLGVDSADPVAKAGLMIRESLSSNSTWAAMMFMPSNRVGLQSRRETGKSSAGALITTSADWLKLVRRRNRVLVQTAHGEAISPGQTVDVLGRLSWRDGEVMLTETRCRQIAEAPGSQLPDGLESDPDGASPELRQVHIGNLGDESRKAELEGRIGRFRIRGITTFNGNILSKRLFFVQDGSAGCTVRFRAGIPVESVQEGQLVEVTGNLTVTNGLPEFAANGFAVIGGGVMPKSLRHPFDPAKTDRRVDQWVEIEGVGRTVRNGKELMVMTREGILPVWTANDLSNSFNQCVNALVRIRGVYWEAPDPVLLLASERFVEVQEPAPRNPFDIPAFPIASLRDQSTEQWLVRQVKIAGVVTCAREEFFIVQDESGGERVQTRNSAGVELGDAVEVAGFPSEQPFGHVLSDAVIRRLGRGKMPLAIELSTGDGLDASKNGLVVTLEAVVLEQRSWRGNQLLDLQAGQRAFRAVLPTKGGQLSSIATGSKVRVTGVSQIESAERTTGEMASGDKPLVASLELLLRSPTDLTVLQRPPWWTWEYTVAVVAISLGITIGSVIWIRTLRRRVEQRTGQLREAMARLRKETQVSATLAERDRLAAEIHDSVEQGLSAIMMQMDAASKVIHLPEEVGHYLTMARNMAGFSRTEVQHAVWDLQSPMLENANLETALRRVAREISAGDQPQVMVEISGQVRQLPSAIEHHLLRVAQEAITNAVKHANPKIIRVSLNYCDESVKLSIVDDGRGFDPQAVLPGSGHFGLQGLRSRAQKITASLNLHSRHGEGTRIEMVVPTETPAPAADA